ncbi:TPA: hypothetical protein QDZ83_004452 [Pluralibacter gergoviae]|nr:hypothetical protein [Pluralibacter gergoviae]EKV9933865.1 hypothetical protein [Pluralibacter gergoviae]OUF45588.1 hypothetical protein AZ034_000057 [Pluralibacter gergoviae]HDS1081291.1 hypothetical protein [Pluralibacter gergoviae]
MLTITEIQDEAVKFRKLIETCDKKNTSLVIDCFPVMSCKLSSMLLSYHFLKLWPELVITGVSAATGKDDHITHYWLEINDIVIDITGDQYNIIDDKELNNKIINSRPFPAVHVVHKKKSYLYKIFKIKEEEHLVSGFPTIGEDFIEDMTLGYQKLISLSCNS